jgi:hypothetical protein
VGWCAGWWLFARALRLPLAGASADASDVIVVVPARNEAATLPRLLDALHAQQPPAGAVVVVDDGSTDGTAAIARRAGVTVLAGAAVPDGWTGKSWACAQGAAATDSDLLVFLDADTRPAPGFLAAVVAEQRRLGGVVTVQPFHRTEHWRERAAAIFNVVAVMGVGGASAAPAGGRVAGAYGPCIVCRRDDYDAAGGHAGVRSSVVEDLDLGQHFVASGIAVHPRLGRGVLDFRMYATLPALVEGFTKNFAFGATGIPRVRTLAIFLWVTAMAAAVVALTSAVAPTSAVGQRGLIVPVLAYVLVVAQLAVFLHRVGNFGLVTAIAFPLPLAVFVIVCVLSLAARARGVVTWKGRTIATRASSP